MVNLVASATDLLKNVYSLDGLGRGASTEKALYRKLIKNGKVFVAARTGARWLFAPSRFAGYANNGAGHERIRVRDGRRTNRHITSLIGNFLGKGENRYDAIDSAFLNFCKRHQIVPSKSHIPRRYWIISQAQADYAVGVAASSLSSSNAAGDLEELQKRTNITPTARRQLVDARIGQGTFRRKLVRYWKCCAFTGCGLNAVLRASHIMPWRQATDEQRLDPSNGLLLEATIDALFDNYLITFADDGSIKISPELNSYVQIFPLEGSLRKPLLKAQKIYLKSHRREFDRRRRAQAGIR